MDIHPCQSIEDFALPFHRTPIVKEYLGRPPVGDPTDNQQPFVEEFAERRSYQIHSKEAEAPAQDKKAQSHCKGLPPISKQEPQATALDLAAIGEMGADRRCYRFMIGRH